MTDGFGPQGNRERTHTKKAYCRHEDAEIYGIPVTNDWRFDPLHEGLLVDSKMEPSSRCSIPASIGVDVHLMANKQPGQMEPSPRGQTPMVVDIEPLLMTNEQPAQMELLPDIETAMPSSMEPQQSSTSLSFVQVGASSKFQNPMPALRPQQLSLKNRQSILIEQSPRAYGSSSFKLALQQPLSTNGPSMQKEPSSKFQMVASANKGTKQLPSVSKVARMEHLPKVQGATSPTLGTPQLSSKNKRKSQTEKLSKVQSINLAAQVASPAIRKAAQAEPSPKVQSESFESVRSKLRESLAAALVLVPEAQRNSQATEKTQSTMETNVQGEMADDSGKQVEASTITTSVFSCPLSETCSEPMSSKGNECDVPLKLDESHCLPSDAFTSGGAADYTQIWKCDMQDFELKHTSLGGDMSFGNNLVFKDELLQGNGLCWASDNDFESSALKEGEPKRLKLTLEGSSMDTKESVVKTQHLATKIEAELFRLFGGVNKKYKEKGRSLLFNLKDPNNPELRERVFSEEITPERLCSMTAEELASKQLTEWRIAKAEEFAQMVVLPESDIDLRRLVKKTHKGEFQVEVEKDDTIPVEVAVGANSLPQVSTRANETKNVVKSIENEAQNSTMHGETEIPDNSAASKKLDLGSLRPQDMQDLMVDELKDTEFLPAILSLDEFMEALDSEPPFQSLPVDAVQDSPTKKKGSDSQHLRSNSMPDRSYVENAVPENSQSKSDDTLNYLNSKPDKASDSLVSKQDHLHTASADLPDSSSNHADEIDSRNTSTNNNHALCSGSISEVDNGSPGITANGDNVWEGLVQLNISSLVTVSGFFKSGEKTSTKEWPGFLEIKGRVRVDAFEKFLQELPSSRSRAIMISWTDLQLGYRQALGAQAACKLLTFNKRLTGGLMVVHFQWKEGSPESGRASLIETADSYVADERVGYAEPAPGVELYFCPPHSRTVQMLEKHLPKEHLEALAASTDGGLVGIVVWRRPHVTSAVSPRLSNHKHSSSSRKHLVSSRKPPPLNSNADVAIKRPAAAAAALPAPVNTILEPQPEEAADDVPPGFGPRATRDEDDLPEFDFRGSRPTASNPRQGGSGVGMSHSHGRPLARRPADQMRELIHKYGQGESGTGSGIPSLSHMQPHMQPWGEDDDDDDIPEWRPHQDSHPPSQGLHRRTQPPSHQANPHLMPMAARKPPLLAVHAPPQLVSAMALPMQPPPMGATQLAQTAWQQQGAWWPHARMPVHGAQQPCHYGGQAAEGQHNGMMGGYGNLPDSADWRSDVHNRGRGM
ncbi:hypothetical protein Taro_018123 [Colocasia esculenta]|uniref:TFIIS central domain-containing protein n=1 Tax=Colocasia esculenta TaxID=4460 RepID=A0A843UPX1_COLES|nr:hypothetical protein [Colocasia esculenta]